MSIEEERREAQDEYLRNIADMNEYDAWGIMKPHLDHYGVPTRLENAAAASVPDVMLVSGGMIILIELKIDYGGYFFMSTYQHGYAKRINNYMKPHMQWTAVWNDEAKGFFMFAFARVKQMETEFVHQKLKFHWEPVWERMPKKFILRTQEQYDEWIDAIEVLEKK